MNLINVEDATEVIIGQTYLVNAVWTKLSVKPYCGEQIPILGTAHEDREIIGFPYDHYHVDWRFVTEAMLEHIRKAVSMEYEYSRHKPFRNYLLGLPIQIDHAGAPGRVALECKRLHWIWDADVRWLPHLERAYMDKRANCNTCPHRGISLVGAPTDSRGARVCPGHGLAWDKETGALRPRGIILEDIKRQFEGRGVKEYVQARREAGV